ncbi:MAG: hypothetical protein BWY53_00677 [Parcubacteria group bacterium ADurb.Bin326]|nr:MAG: hypothetical protein BWY53_00677 [Parcubacteria group bacterium ADurb.Bin326]
MRLGEKDYAADVIEASKNLEAERIEQVQRLIDFVEETARKNNGDFPSERSYELAQEILNHPDASVIIKGAENVLPVKSGPSLIEAAGGGRLTKDKRRELVRFAENIIMMRTLHSQTNSEMADKEKIKKLIEAQKGEERNNN